MKLKKTYFITFLFSLLLLVGFSPPSSNESVSTNFINNTVYADTLNDEDFSNAVKAYIEANKLTLADNDAALNTLTKNLDKSIGILNKYLDSIFKAAELSMAALSVFAITWIGFEYMSKGSGSLITYIKGREKLANTFLAIVFVFAIPLFIDAINDLTVTKITTDETTDSYIYELSESGTIMSDYFVTPSSSIKTMILNYAKETSAEENSTLFGDSLSTTPKNGILKTIYNILMFILQLAYTPFHFIVTLFGLIGFYPMSFDPAIYGEAYMHAIVPKFNLLNIGTLEVGPLTFFEGVGTGDALVTEIESAVGNAFSVIIVVINLITGIIKKFCMAAIKGACYYYGFKVLTGLETTKVKDFLMRLLQGVLGMFAAPLIMQTLLDIDAMVSTAILSLAGKSIPGVGMMNLILSPEEATANIINFVFAVGMLIVMFFITQAFLFRRLELIMYYLLAPPVFLKHIFQPQSKIVSHWFKTVASAAFVTTTYSPLFVLVQFLIIFGLSVSGEGAARFINQIIYYIMIWFIIFKGQNIVLLAVDLLFGGRSASDTMMRKKTQEGLAHAEHPIATVSKAGYAVGSGIGSVVGGAFGMKKSIEDAIKTEGGGFRGLGKAALRAGVQGITGSVVGGALDGFSDSATNMRKNSWYAQSIAMANQRNEVMNNHGLGIYNKYNGELDGHQAALKTEKDNLDNAKRDKTVASNAIKKVNEDGQFGFMDKIVNRASYKDAVANEISKHVTSSDIKKVIQKGIPALNSDAKDLKTFFNGLNSDEVIGNTLADMKEHGFDKSNPELFKSVKDMQLATIEFKEAQKAFDIASTNNDAYGMSKALITMNKSADKLSNMHMASNLVKSMTEVSNSSNAIDASSVISAFSNIQTVDVAKLKAVDSIKNQPPTMSDEEFKQKFEVATGVKLQGDIKTVREEIVSGKNEVFNTAVAKNTQNVDVTKLKAIDSIKNQTSIMSDAEYKQKFEVATGVKLQGNIKTVREEIASGKNEVFNEVVIKANETINKARTDFSKVSNGQSAGKTQAEIINNIDLIQKGQNKEVEKIVVENATNSNLGSFNATISNISNISNISDEIRTVKASKGDTTQLENKLNSLLKQQGVRNVEVVREKLISGNKEEVNTQIVQMMSTDRARSSISNIDKTVQKALENAHSTVKSQSATLDTSIKSVNRKINEETYVETKLVNVVESVGKSTFYKVNPVTVDGVKYKTSDKGKIIDNGNGPEKLETTGRGGEKIDYHQQMINEISRQAKNAQNAANSKPLPNTSKPKGSTKVDNIKDSIKHSTFEGVYEDFRNGHDDF